MTAMNGELPKNDNGVFLLSTIGCLRVKFDAEAKFDYDTSNVVERRTNSQVSNRAKPGTANAKHNATQQTWPIPC